MAGLTAVWQDIVNRTDNIGAVTGITVANHTRKFGVGFLLMRTVKVGVVTVMTVDTEAGAANRMAGSRTYY